MWFLYALASGSFYTVSGLVTRYVLKEHKDAWAFSFYFSAVGALVSLPFMLQSPKMPSISWLWLLMLGVGCMIVGHNWLNFSSSKYLEASVQGTVVKLRLVWAFIAGVLLLHEMWSVQKLIGTCFAIVAGLLIVKHFRKPESVKGVALSVASTFVYAAVIVLYKVLFKGFNAPTLTFFIFLIPTIINLIIMPNALSRVSALFRAKPIPIFLSCALGGFANLAMNQALVLGEISRVLVIIESFLVLTLIGEHVFLKEKEHLKIKLIAVLCAIIGAILIRL